jgi:hypothetical protein
MVPANHAEQTVPMTSAQGILQDAFDRVHELVPAAVEGLTTDELLWRPDADANHIAWLVWHLSRVQDDHLAGVGEVEQAWTAQGWSGRFGLPYAEGTIGYGQSSDDVGAFVLQEPELLTGYHEAVHALTRSVLSGLSDDDLSRVVDDSWDPPVTAATRLVSVVNDVSQHVGQAGYVRGLVERRR